MDMSFTTNVDDSIIEYMSRATGVKYSDEQLAILRHHGGMCILASAGSGKTTVLNHLIAKRIQTKEIADPSKLLCTTFSRGGATEMGQRLEGLLQQLGIRSKVQVKTLHAVYLQLLKDLGYNLEIVENSKKMHFIREACKDAGLRLEDEDYQTLESIFGYQINNLMSDEQLFKSYAYTLREQIPLDKYSYIRQAFNNKKQMSNCMDFDDMQLFIYMLFKNPQYSAALQTYCHSLWKYIYVDEAQDVSKIQFEILKFLISDPDKLVFIGDDDQCLVEGTMVSVPGGAYAIEDIKPGDIVLSALGDGYTGFSKVTNVSMKPYKGKIVKVVTENGHKIEATPEHVVFARRHETDMIEYNENGMIYQMFSGELSDKDFIRKWKAQRFKSICRGIGGCEIPDIVDTSDLDTIEEKVHEVEKSGTKVFKQAKLTEKMFDFVRVGDLQVGMELVHTMPCNSLMTDKIKSIEVLDYKGNVYDIRVPETRNFIANRLVVHNCIYQWRGADPSIILNICGIYTDLTLMTLTTNYRCKSNIVDPAAVGIEFNRVRSQKTMRPYQSGGEIKLVDTGTGDMYEMSKYAYKIIKQLVIDDGVMPSDIAVLSRNNQHLTILNNLLFKDGIFCKSSDDMKFTKCSMYRLVNGIMQLGMNTTNGNITGDNLWKVCLFMKRSISVEIGKIQSAYGLPIKDILGLLLTKYAKIPNLDWEDPGIKVSQFDNSKYMSLIYRMQRETLQSLEMVYGFLCERDQEKAVVGLLQMFLETKVNLFFKAEEAMRFATGYVMYLSECIKHMGIANFKNYLRSTEQFEAGGMAVISPMITLSTMHGAKGKEWKHVIIFADDNVSFPSFQNITQNMEAGVPDSDIRCMIDENRRLHYVAMTRAKEHLYILGNKKNFGVFTLESLGIMDFGNDNDSHIIAMAQHGIYQDLVKKTESELFNPESEYVLDIDIKSLETNIEEKYKKKGSISKASDVTNIGDSNVPLATSGFNINNIQTFAPMVTGDE